MLLEYDGSLEGFFSLVHTVFHERLSGLTVKSRRGYGKEVESGLFDSPLSEDRFIESDRNTALEVYGGIRRRYGYPVLDGIVRAFLSEEPGTEELLIEFLRRSPRRGPDIFYDLADPVVAEVDRKARRTGRELHRYTGLIRFRELADRVYYAPFGPDTNILPLLAPHFRDRFGETDWVIHDTRRGTALFCREGKTELVRLLDAPDIRNNHDLLSEAEKQFSRIWRSYYNTIGVKERTNPALRRQFMPLKTWGYLPEMEGM